jgi:hypothetical protein
VTTKLTCAESTANEFREMARLKRESAFLMRKEAEVWEEAAAKLDKANKVDAEKSASLAVPK